MKSSAVLITVNTSDDICLRIFSNGYVIIEQPDQELYQCDHLLSTHDDLRRLVVDLQYYSESTTGTVHIMYSINHRHTIRRYNGIPNILFNLINMFSSRHRIPSLHSHDQDGRIIIYSNNIIHYCSPSLRIDEISEIDYSNVIQSLIDGNMDINIIVEKIVTRMKILY